MIRNFQFFDLIQSAIEFRHIFSYLSKPFELFRIHQMALQLNKKAYSKQFYESFFFFFLSFLMLASIAIASAQDKFDVNLKPGAPIPGTLYGIFFEDINYGADGGLYAELIKNRYFEFPGNPLQWWKVFGNVSLRDDGPFENNPHYVHLDNPGHPHMSTGIENEGFFGIGVRTGEEYRLTFWAMTSGDSSLIRVELIDNSSNSGMTIASAEVCVAGKQWKKYETLLQPKSTFDESSLRIVQQNKKVSVDLEHISLFPVNTWNGRENGLRRDIVQALFDLHPGVFRFPGGCIVEGTNLASRYQWKNSVGPVENSPLNLNRWQYTFGDRLFPDYYQSYGLGFYEYFLVSEDICAEPLPVINCGLACQFQNNDINAHARVDSLDEYIQDAHGLIEFANGDVDSKWGYLRSMLGHPEPFDLKIYCNRERTMGFDLF